MGFRKVSEGRELVGEVIGFSVGQVTSWGDHGIMKGKSNLEGKRSHQEKAGFGLMGRKNVAKEKGNGFMMGRNPACGKNDKLFVVWVITGLKYGRSYVEWWARGKLVRNGGGRGSLGMYLARETIITITVGKGSRLMGRIT